MTTDSAFPADPRFADLERALLAAGASPRLIWYGPDRERIELSGAVLLNWSAKTANFVVEECDLEPGDVVLLDAPVHWRTLAIALGCWQAGAVVGLGAPGRPVRVRFWAPPAAGPAAAAADDAAASADAETGADTDVAVSLGALDLAFPGRLPAGAVDYAAEIRAYGDGFMGEPAPGSMTLTRDGAVVPFALPDRPGDGPGAVRHDAADRAAAPAATGNHGSGADLLRSDRTASTTGPGGTRAGSNTGTPGRTVALDPAPGLAATLAAAVPLWLSGTAVLVADSTDRVSDVVLRDERAVRAF